ncbi:MAG TPA: DUF4232 domain-containing protein [Streptosporangiaceae bacterium]|nr:DUF4232 domain-containing protein [Streptosporangiaceae bacterium]
MKLITRSSRRATMAVAIASAAILLPAVALASSTGSGSAATGSAVTGTRSHAAAKPQCARSWLTSWMGVPGDAAAGSTYYQLEISNVSGHTCTLSGFPGVSALGRGGTQLGSAAGRNHGHAVSTLTLQPRQTAHVLLQIADVGNFSRAACHPATADTLRVFAPGDFASMKFPFSFRACARRGPVYLHVSTTISGAGIPGYSS